MLSGRLLFSVSVSFCNQPILFAQLEIVNKLWNYNRTVHVNEIKRKTKPSHITFELTTRSTVRFSYKQCNGIKGWLHCLMAESKERCLVNNILFGSA